MPVKICDLPCESIKTLHFVDGQLFFVELKITLNLTYMGRITSPVSFDTTYVGKIFMVDCPGLKLGNSVKTHLCQI